MRHLNYGAAINKTVANFKNRYKEVHGRCGYKMAGAATTIRYELEWAFDHSDEGRGTKHNVYGVTVYLPKLDNYTKYNVLSYISDVIYKALNS